MAPLPPNGVLVQVSSTEAGTFATIGYIDTHSYDVARDRADKIRYYNDGSYTPPGDLSRTLALTGAVDTTDATGQNILRTAMEDETDPSVWVRLMPDGVEVGATGRQFEAKTNSYSESGDRNSDEPISFDAELEIEGTPTAYTVPI